MIKNNLVIKKKYINRFRDMIDHIEKLGETHLCPLWSVSLKDYSSHNYLVSMCASPCNICKKYFKKISYEEGGQCPCGLYKPSYLVRFLKKVISNSIE